MCVCVCVCVCDTGERIDVHSPTASLDVDLSILNQTEN